MGVVFSAVPVWPRMFIHQSQLRHLLRPDQYVSDEQHRLELDRLFRRAWHPVAAAAELADPGQYLTIRLFDAPLLLRNIDGRICAFLNACPHRHSAIADKPWGRSERFLCQYHGWEFTADGRTGKIPDARAFRPWDRENARLKAFPVDTCAGLVFVKLTDGGPTLREFLAPLWNELEAGFAPPYRYATTWEAEFPCNWKVVLENSLESYHVPQVHPKTFKVYPDEPACEHELHEAYSTFHTPTPRDMATRAMYWMVRRLGRPVTGMYSQQVLHPHVTFNRLDVYRMVQCVFPTGPQSCRYRSILFTLAGPRRNPFSRMVAAVLRPLVVMTAKRVFHEDAAIYAGVQKGLAVSPHRGVIGTREERIYPFQQFVLDRCGQSAGPDPAVEVNGCAACPSATGCAAG